MAYQQGYYPQDPYQQQQGYNNGWQQPQYGQQPQYQGQYAAPNPDPYMNHGVNAWGPPPGVNMYANGAADPYATSAQWGQHGAQQQMYQPNQGGYPAAAYGAAPAAQYGQGPYPGYQQPGYQAPQQQQYPAYAPPVQPDYAAAAYQPPVQPAQPAAYPAQPGYSVPSQYPQNTAPQEAYPTSQPAAYPTSAAQPQPVPVSSAPPQPTQDPYASQSAASAPAFNRDVSGAYLGIYSGDLQAQPTVSAGLPSSQPVAGAGFSGSQAQPTLSSAPTAVGFGAQTGSPPPGFQAADGAPRLNAQASLGGPNLTGPAPLPAGPDTDVTQSGRLFLEVIGGRNLKNMELFSKQDPYMKINFKAYKVRTKTHHSGGRAPVWNQTFSFELDGKDPDINIECYDEDPGKDDFIGGASVNIQQVVNGKGSEVWIPISNKKGVNTGEVCFKAKFAQYRPAILKFKLVDAKGLPCPDGGKLDPYVIFYVDGDKANKVLAKSKVHKNGGACPIWNQDFNFKLTGREQFLDLDVWDDDRTADLHCGNARLRFMDLRQAAPGTQRFPLTRPGKQSTATIGVAVEFVPIP